MNTTNDTAAYDRLAYEGETNVAALGYIVSWYNGFSKGNSESYESCTKKWNRVNHLLSESLAPEKRG